jgi:ketosteroid isomerase-like protein
MERQIKPLVASPCRRAYDPGHWLWRCGYVTGDKGVTMGLHPNVMRVRDAYAAFAKADLNGALKDLADDAVFHFNGEGPNSGDHKGRAAIERALIANFELTGGTQSLEIKDVFADDNHGVVVAHETATRTDGATLGIDEVHVLAINPDGKITDLWDLPTDPDVHDAFFDGR